ncbi:hypothetical protein [Amycolatopsis albispora]|uniref:Protein kinase domain-containing protein n=1 Tax=Amycolatopsis albispora TaxID=1804986 RepID=A0A344L5D7_9PSEU|nr:hypothetical protein [Amycolatopsis albispora]AXB43261.1 hypothetical protein A4R43_12445 [Amycolatopsis albispora]
MPASDLFSLGVALFQAVEGVSPFDRGSGMATLSAVLLEELPEPVRAGPLTPVIQDLTGKDTGLRLTAAQGTALLSGQPPRRRPHRTSSPSSSSTRGARRSRSSRSSTRTSASDLPCETPRTWARPFRGRS